MKKTYSTQSAICALLLYGALIFGEQISHAQSYSVVDSDAQEIGSEVSIFSSAVWEIESIQDLVCIEPKCESDIGVIVARVILEGDEDAIEVSPDRISVSNSRGEQADLNGVLLMEIPSSAKASVVGLMTEFKIAIGDIEYSAQPYGFAYEGKFSESLISGGIVMGPNGFSPQQGSKTIVELFPMELDTWLTQETHLALRREIFSGNNVDTETVLAFLMNPGAGERMLLAGPQGKTVVVALLFNRGSVDFETLNLSEDQSLNLRPGRFDRLMDAISDWWSS